MTQENARAISGRVILALAIIAAGFLLLFNNLTWQKDIDLWDFWPALVILIGGAKLFSSTSWGETIDGLFLMLLGGMLLETNLHLIPGLHLRWREIWPLILVYVGVRMLLVPKKCCGEAAFKGILINAEQGKVDRDQFDVVAMFSGAEYTYTSKTLLGGSIRAVFGGCDLDFRSADTAAQEMEIECLAMFGGIEMQVPDHWRVTVQGFPIFGGMENKTRLRDGLKPEEIRNVLVRGNAMFGGI
ncbi:MAG TPA: DUF5668 domain-containing protein, partial [Candidatus Aminicenantes bacterium]|nr:DUF5668 domain-containing protein [Candidatus Aminicenantes bacterium]